MSALHHGKMDKLLTMANELKAAIAEVERKCADDQGADAARASIWLLDAHGLLQYVIRNLARAHNEVIKS